MTACACARSERSNRSRRSDQPLPQHVDGQDAAVVRQRGDHVCVQERPRRYAVEQHDRVAPAHVRVRHVQLERAETRQGDVALTSAELLVRGRHAIRLAAGVAGFGA